MRGRVPRNLRIQMLPDRYKERPTAAPRTIRIENRPTMGKKAFVISLGETFPTPKLPQLLPNLLAIICYGISGGYRGEMECRFGWTTYAWHLDLFLED